MSPESMLPLYDLGSGYTLEKADESLFAVYQTIYSNADVEMWYDWNMRLNDTRGTENCFFLKKDGQKLGGAVVMPNRFFYPFLVYPFCDRRLFYMLLHKALLSFRDPASPEITAGDVLDQDVEVLTTLGYKRTTRSRRVMVRPTDSFEAVLPEGFCSAVPSADQAEEIAAMLNLAFQNTLDAEVLGLTTAEDVREAIGRSDATNTTRVSSLVYHTATQTLAGACIAGVDPKAVNGFAGIWTVGVLPAYRGAGLGVFMVKNALKNAYPDAKVMKLVVTSGNPAENLYHRLGFFPGPRFTRMVFS